MSLTGFYVHVFDRLGRCFFSHLLGIFTKIIHSPVQMDIYLAFYSGLACRPADSLIARFCGRSFSRDSNPGWGDWSRSLCGWVCFVVCFVFSGNYVSVIFACHATGLDAVQRLEQKKHCDQALRMRLHQKGVRLR